MRKSLVFVLVIGLAGLSLTGCATKEYVQEQVQASQQVTETKIAEVQTQVETNQQDIDALEAQDAEFEKQLAQLSETARDALMRAQEAGKLAKGKFLYEVTLTDNDVQFGLNKAALSDQAKAELDEFANQIKGMADGSVYVEIQGHTDATGSEKYNLELGFERAENVMRYLNEAHGFPLHRMNVISYGEFKPVADNSNREGRAQNRRVSLVVLQ